MVVHITVFGYITVTKNLIGCNSLVGYKSFADYTSLVTQKAVDKMIIGLAAGVFTMKIAAVEGFVLEAVEINGDGMHIKINLIEQDIKVLL